MIADACSDDDVVKSPSNGHFSALLAPASPRQNDCNLPDKALWICTRHVSINFTRKRIRFYKRNRVMPSDLIIIVTKRNVKQEKKSRKKLKKTNIKKIMEKMADERTE